MKLFSIIIFLIFNIISTEALSQNNTDSICDILLPNPRKISYNFNIDSKDIPEIERDSFCSKKMATSNPFSNLYSVSDSLYPLNRRYVDQNGENLTGTFVSLGGNNLDKLGIFGSHGFSFLPLTASLWGCLKNGVPCCTWKLDISGGYGYESTSVIVNFENGLFHGKYKVKTGTGLVYETIFDHGSGYYLDAYPDGEIRIEGMLKEGKMEGKWVFKIRKEGKKKPEYKKIIRVFKYSNISGPK